MEDVSTTTPPSRRSTHATTVVLLVNLLIYLMVELQGGPTYENLVRFGAKENGLIALGEWHRLITPIFLHAGLMHLGFNMYALYQVGRVLEFMIGSRNFLTLYFVGGITSTLCSFALSPSLSVGASGCLYAVLLALFVLQRYEEQIAKELGLVVPRSPLGMLIVINGLITFVIPNIDWAAHLGGAIAGTLLGLAFIMKHRWKVRMDRCRLFLDPHSDVPRRALWERPSLYTWALTFINAAFTLGYFQVSELDKAFGLGVKEASEVADAPRDSDQIPVFGKLITSEKSETNPRHLAQIGAELHRRGLYLPAFLTYHSVLLLGPMDPAVLSLSERLAVQAATAQSFEGKTLTPELEGVLLGENLAIRERSDEALSGECARAAELLASLRFFKISGKLFEAAYLLNPSHKELAVETFYTLKKQDDLGEVFRFRSVAEQLLNPRETSPETKSFFPKNLFHWGQGQGPKKALRDFIPSDMWSMSQSSPSLHRAPDDKPQDDFPSAPSPGLPPI